MIIHSYLIQDSISGKYFAKNKQWFDPPSDSIATYSSLQTAKTQFKYICVYWGIVNLRNSLTYGVQASRYNSLRLGPGTFQAVREIAHRLRIIEIAFDTENPQNSTRKCITARLQKSRLAFTHPDASFKTPSLKTNFICNLRKNPIFDRWAPTANNQIDVCGKVNDTKILLSMGAVSLEVIKELNTRRSLDNAIPAVPLVYVSASKELTQLPHINFYENPKYMMVKLDTYTILHSQGEQK